MDGARIVIAPDSYKGSASAAAAAAAIGRGWASVRPLDTIVPVPMADGGEGTIEAFEIAWPDATRVVCTVTGPDDRPVSASWLSLPDGTAVVELAAASGITLLDPLRPLDAHTVGFGELIADALGHGATALLLGIGGSSSTDGGTGMLTALGARFLDAGGGQIPHGGRGLARLAHAELGGLRPLPPGGVTVLSDVTNPLLGASGAAAVFAPQKGATVAQCVELDAGLARLSSLLPSADPGAAGAGAAGGTGFGLIAWGARLQSGAAAVAVAVGLEDAIATSDFVVTGEGSFDAQSASGKVPGHVLALGQERAIPVGLVAGRIGAPLAAFSAAVSLTELAGSSAAAIAEAEQWLVQAGAILAHRFRDR